MCRLFGMHTGISTSAEFWLVSAPDNLSLQSRANPDGFGIGTFAPDGTPIVRKRPLPAWSDPEFASTAHTLKGAVFVAHVRHASVGARTEANTHPFEQHGRLFAHNGGFGHLPELDRRLADLSADDLITGQTDSERFFALITAETQRADGCLPAGIKAAVTWVRQHLPVLSLNFILCTPQDIWALRYPATDTLLILERAAGGHGSRTNFSGVGTHIAAHVAPLQNQPAVVLASEQLDDDPGWRELLPGEVVHVGPSLHVERDMMFPDAPSRPLE